MGENYYANVRRTVADFSHAPPNEYSPSPNDKKQWSDVGLGGKLIQKLRQKGVYEESFSRHAAWDWGKLIQFMHTTMVPVQSRLKVVTCMKVKKYVDRGSYLFVAQVVEKEPVEGRLKDVPVICEFPDVFPEDLPGLPPPRQVEFVIELVPRSPTCGRGP
ncbi:hypothetical protein Tco_0584423 [Tanacetum coccineum]